MTNNQPANTNKAVEQERSRCASIADDGCQIRERAGQMHPDNSDARSRCFAGARAAANIAKGIRCGEPAVAVAVEPMQTEDAMSAETLADMIPSTAKVVEQDGKFIGVQMNYAEIRQFAKALALRIVQAVAVEPIYQCSQGYPSDPENTWRDGTKDSYDARTAKNWRVLYSAPTQPEPTLKATP